MLTAVLYGLISLLIGVLFLIKTANQLGITYEEINVWLFVILLPTILLISLLTNWILFLQLLRLKAENHSHLL